MAIIYKKGKELEYTGADKVFKKLGDTLEKIKSAPRKVVGAYETAHKNKKQGDARRELDNISRGFGSVENYEKMYPDTAKRNKKLREQAGY